MFGVASVSQWLSGVACLLQAEGGRALWKCGSSGAAAAEGGQCLQSTHLTLACMLHWTVCAQEFAAYKDHMSSLLEQERGLNRKLRRMIE